MPATLQSALVELALVLVPIVITALLTWVSPYLVRFLDTRVGHNTTVALENFARIAVTAAEQQIKSGANSDKKALALSALSAFAADHRYDTSAANLEALIEAAVYQLKQWGPISVSTLNVPAPDGSGSLTSTATTVNVVNEAASSPAAPEAAPVAPAVTAAPDPEAALDPAVSHQTATF